MERTQKEQFSYITEKLVNISNITGCNTKYIEGLKAQRKELIEKIIQAEMDSLKQLISEGMNVIDAISYTTGSLKRNIAE